MAAIDASVMEHLKTELGGDPALVKDLVQTFLDESPQLIARMRDASSRGDAPLLMRAAHTLKSTSATFGALRLSDLSKDLETLGRTGRTDGASGRIEALGRAYAEVEAELRRWLTP